MIDKLVFKPEMVLNEEPIGDNLNRKLRLHEIVYINAGINLVEVSINGSERGRYRFFAVEGCEGILFKCNKAGRGTPALDHAIENIEMNPNHRCFGSNVHIFLRRVEAIINPTVFEYARLIRIDYALDVPYSIETVMRGLSFAGRSIHKLQYTPRRVDELLIGTRQSSALAAYDYNRRHEIATPASPVTRLEMRLFEKSVPRHLKQLRQMSNILSHVQALASGDYNPFSDVVLRVGFDFAEIEPPALPASGRVTREYRQAWMNFCLSMRAEAAVQAMLGTTSYARAERKALQAGSGLRSVWMGMTVRHYDLQAHFVRSAQDFLREAPRPRFRSRSVPNPLPVAA